MDTGTTFVRGKNWLFFVALGSSKRVKDAVLVSGLSQAQATRLIVVWKKAGLVREVESLHGRRKVYTPDGLSLLMSMQDFMRDAEVLWQKKK
jgi:hypothetical protein